MTSNSNETLQINNDIIVDKTKDMSNKDNIISLIKDITMFYVKHHYHKYLKKHKLQIIPERDLKIMIEDVYFERQGKLRKYIRDNLKQHLGENYTSMVIENILCKMFEDDKYCKERLHLEIIHFQNSITNKT
jgi:hypothetical protein